MGPTAVRTCAFCTGTLVEQPRLVPLLEHLARSLRGRVDFDVEPDAMPDNGERLPCPSCGKTMDAFGYMGTNKVIVDRCGEEGLIWADPGELGGMAVLYARTNLRVKRIHGLEKDQRVTQHIRTAALHQAQIERDREPPGRYDGRAKQWSYLMRRLFGGYEDE
tara:strand:- start:59 stop:547 length:489 start_codon:yes stop_codon:yes gene_type:complete